MRRGFHLFLILCLLLISTAAFADKLDDAMESELSGDVSQALDKYRNWLDDNSGDSRFPDVLLHTASLSQKSSDTLKILEHYLPELRAVDTPKILVRMAGLASSYGLPGLAANYFQRAASFGEPDADLWMYDSLSLRFTMGEYHEVRVAALSLAENTREPILRDNAVSLAAVSLAYGGNSPDSFFTAIDELNRYINKNTPVESPLLWFALHEIALLANDSQVLRYSENKLHEDFPTSLVSYITDSKILEWNSPSSYIFRPINTKGKSVQVAAFSSREKAAELRLRLENDNFVSWIEQNGDIWRVFVNDPSRDAVSRLIAAGYESLF